VAQRSLGRGGEWAPSPCLSRPAPQPCALALRARALGLGGERLHAARPQGLVGGRHRPGLPLERGGEARRPPARPARPGPTRVPGMTLQQSVARQEAAGKTPVSLVTGFLGSGKTTLISRLLAHPDMGETAVIVNELGE